MRSPLGILPLALAAATCCPPGARAQARFTVIGGLEHNLGAVPLRPIHDTLRVRNAGTMPLHIISINPTCGCTAAAIDTTAVAPGDTARVFVTIDPPDNLLPSRKTIVFLTNDFVNPSQEFAYRFTILRDVGAAVPYFAFANCRVGRACTCGVTLINFADHPVTLFREPFPIAGLRSLMPDTLTIPAHDSVAYRLRWTPLDAGLQKGRIALRTNSTISPRLEFTVMANVEDRHGNLVMPRPRR